MLERNRFYRGPRPANVDRIVWTFASPGACRQAADRNEVDHCWFVPPQDIPQIVARYGINRRRFFRHQALLTFFFTFNHDRPAFKGTGQIPLKQAINLVLDRHALAAASPYLSLKRTDQILPEGLGRDASIYPLGVPPERSIARARTLVARAAVKPDKLVLYTHIPGFKGVNAAWAQIFKFDRRETRHRRRDQVLRLVYGGFPASRHAGGAVRRPHQRLDPGLPGRRRLLRAAAGWKQPRGDRKQQSLLLRPAEGQHGDRADREPHRRRAPQGLGEPGREADARRSPLGPVCSRDVERLRLEELRLLCLPAGLLEHRLRRAACKK